MSSFTPIDLPVRTRAGHASFPCSTVVSLIPPSDQPSQITVESGPGPPATGATELQLQRMPELPDFAQALVPQMPLPELPPPAPQLSQVPQAVEAIEVIDLTGVSDDEDEDEDRDDWDDVPDVVDLTNLPSDDDKDDANDSNEALDGLPLNYTIPNLRPRRHALVDGPPLAGQTCSRRAARVPARVPVRRDICELCARVVRWGPGCLVTKHHLYPQEITRKYPDRYTQAERGAVALLCRPCHDACHRAHSNRILADFYFSVDLLKADPHVQAHIRTMQRATTPELIARHGDGVHVRRRKERRRAAMTVKQRKVASRYMLRKTASRVTVPRPSPPPPPPPPGVRRSARLLAKSMGGRSEAPVIVIEDEDEDMQDAVIHVDTKETENEGAQDIVSQEELLALEARGEYIPL